MYVIYIINHVYYWFNESKNQNLLIIDNRGSIQEWYIRKLDDSRYLHLT